MIQTSTGKTDVYWEKFDQFQKLTRAQDPAWLLALRKKGMARFAEMGFPSIKDEDWRFTNVAPIIKLPFRPSYAYSPSALEMDALRSFALIGLKGSRLVFVDGHYSAALSWISAAHGELHICTLSEALAKHGEILERYLGQGSANDQQPIVALNTAFFNEGAFIHAPADVVAKEPIQLLHIASSQEVGLRTHPRHLIVAEKNSAVTVIENYTSLADNAYVTNAVTELFVGDGARVEHCKFQDEALSAYHLSALHAQLGGDCNVISHSFALGAMLSRHNIRTALAGEGIECILNGLYLTKDNQLADHHMVVEHVRPNCNSHEYFNGILDGRSKAVFHGRILVQPQAQKTDAKQTNKNLLLSDDATVDTKPQLEIYADDVKCTHGATIGQLNEESIFYLRARGIGKETARRMLMHAFAGEIIDRIRLEPVRTELDQLVWARLEQNKQIAMAS